MQSSLRRNFLVSCNPLRDTHLITNDLLEDTHRITNDLPYLLIKHLIVSCGLRHKPKTDHVTIRLTLHNLDFSQNHPVTPNTPGRSIFQYPPSPRKKTKNTEKIEREETKLKKRSHNHQEKTAVQWKNLA